MVQSLRNQGDDLQKELLLQQVSWHFLLYLINKLSVFFNPDVGEGWPLAIQISNAVIRGTRQVTPLRLWWKMHFLSALLSSTGNSPLDPVHGQFMS